MLTWQVLAIGAGGAWIFISIATAALLWSLYQNGGFPFSAERPSPDAGPLQFFYNLTFEGALGRPIYSIRFYGSNISQKEVSLKSASIRSATKGTELPLEVVAENEILKIDQINLIPSGSPIELVAKFNAMPTEDFLGTWSKFNLVVLDDTREYRLPFNEGNIAALFPGKVGPHITKRN